MKTNNLNNYNAEAIQILEGLEAVRRRPGMYVGGTDVKALHHLIYEVVDNSIDEALAGVATEITVIIHPDDSVTVKDNGRGIPTDIHPGKKISDFNCYDRLTRRGKLVAEATKYPVVFTVLVYQRLTRSLNGVKSPSKEKIRFTSSAMKKVFPKAT